MLYNQYILMMKIITLYFTEMFVLACAVLLVFSTSVSVLVENISTQEDQPPVWIQQMVVGCLGKLVCVQIPDANMATTIQVYI